MVEPIARLHVNPKTMVITSPEDAHRRLVEEAEYSWTLGLMAYAIVEDQKYEWIAHLRSVEDREPTTAEIETWFRNRTPESFTRAVSDAERALQLVADDALGEIIADERRTAAESAIVSLVKGMTGGWRQFGIGVAAGLISAFLFATLIAVVALIVLGDRSVVDLVEALRNDQIEQQQPE